MRAESVEATPGAEPRSAPTKPPSPAFPIAWRYLVGLSWALALAAGGGWLVVSPWAVAGQGRGTWSSETTALVASGAGLLLLAGLGMVLVLLDVASYLRGETQTAPARLREVTVPRPDAEQALVELAQALTRQLELEQRPVPTEVARADSGPEQQRVEEIPAAGAWREVR